MGDTTGIFDEYTLIQRKGGPTSQEAISFMQKHWETAVTADDLDAMQSGGITHVRIPVGWWLAAYDVDDGFVDGGKVYLERVLGMLADRNMGAVIDLHAAPGAQTAGQGFTGKKEDNPGFFDDAAKYEQGKAAIISLAEYIKSLDGTPAGNAITGMEFVNEPERNYFYSQPRGVRTLYEEMVPKVRAVLPSSRYKIYLSFIDMPTQSGPWLAQMIAAGPASVWANVIYDKHLYHAFGDDDGSVLWTDSMDSCKTCCRDPKALEGLGGVPFIVGEWSLTTASLSYFEHSDPAFLRSFWANQLSLWKTAAEGHFFWTHRVSPKAGDAGYFLPFHYLQLLQPPVSLPAPADLELDSICPAEDVSKCPSFHAHSVQWNSACEWSSLPSPSPPPPPAPPTPVG